METRITEAEIIDVLLGDADPALEARVRQAVRHDPEAAALYVEWTRVIPPIQQAAAPLKSMNERVRDKVMRRLAEDPLTAGAQYFIGAEALETGAGRWARPRWLTRKLAAWVVAALVLCLLGGPALWELMHPELVAEAVNGQITLIGRDGKAAALRPGEVVPLPARLQAAPGARAEIRLADRSRLVLGGGGAVAVEGRRQVRQVAGAATYTVAPRIFGKLFTVQIPQGQVVDLGTEFKVSVREGEASVVRVSVGRVRVTPSEGRSLEAVAGERAIVDRGGAVIEPVPPCPDLAEARARYETRLTRRGPAPAQPVGALALPAGVREAWYPSGSLHLRAWLTPPPQAGQRRPAVVYAHGGFALTAQDWANTALLRAAGFVVMAPMLRGENGNPGDFECGWGEVDDLKAAGAWLATQPGVDPARIYLVGRGEGGTLAMLAAMMESPFAAAVATQARTDANGLSEAAGGTLPFNPAEPMERMLRSPRDFPESLRIPLHLVVGQGDGERLQAAQALARDAIQAGKRCQLWTVPGDRESSLGAAGQIELQILQVMINQQP